MVDLVPKQDGSSHYLSTKQKNGLTKLISLKTMFICLKLPYYFYTNINFQRPISHLILIWDPLKFHHSYTLQIKLSNFGRSSPPNKICLYIIYPLHKNGLTKLINVKSMAIYLIIPYYFYTN